MSGMRLAVVGVTLAFALPAGAGGAEAEGRLREANDRLRELLAGAPDAADVGRVVDGLLDYEGLSRRALSNHWTRLTAAQRDEFLAIFRKLVEKSYKENLKETLDNIAIDYLGWEDIQGGNVLVRTLVRKIRTRRARRAQTAIAYEMTLVDGVWKVIDVITDDVSLVQSYRDQFNSIIGRAASFDAGWADLMSRMRRKLEGD